MSELSNAKSKLSSANSQVTKLTTQLNDANSEIESLTKERDNLTKDLEKANSSLGSSNTELKTANEQISKIKTFFASGNPGYASDNFYVNKPILFLKKSGSAVTVTLKGHINGGGGEYALSSSNEAVAQADWTTEGDFSVSTTFKITPVAAGTTEINITNNLNSQKLKVLVIVTE